MLLVQKLSDFKDFLINILFVSKLITSLLMHCDSQATKAKAKSKILMKKKTYNCYT